MGRYQEPAQKQVAFLFLDVVGSSRMTEQIGDTKTQKLIAELFFEVAVIVERLGGDVHRYIGDEMVVTWELSDKTPMPDILGCLSQIYETVESHREENLLRHQTWVNVRAGLNAGSVLVSEIGDLKRELVYFGDSINTAASLQNQCKIEGTRVLISNVLYKLLEPSPRLKAESLGLLSIKGKQRQIDTVSLTYR
ncbi:MAG: adenylate/guanylate cyclase domain-containing protein [Motiliproteus sp.]|nr:adenylate/guanylate cyclase domain-containing protein [Motiliproteus sp.]